MGLKQFKEETWKYLDGLHPDDIARDFVNAGNDGKVIYTAYILKQPEKRANEIRENIESLNLRR